MTLVSIALQQLGMDPKACELFLKVLRQTQYHMKMKLGVSLESYGNDSDTTLHGPGQGCRAGPAAWVLESCLIMSCMPEKSDGMLLTDPFEDKTIEQIMTGFMDDTTHFLDDFLKCLAESDSLYDLVENTTIKAQWWEELLYAIGQKMELPKCFWYLIVWLFNQEGEATLAWPEHLGHEIKINDSETSNAITITQKPCDELHKTLGAMESPAPDYTDEYK